MEHTPKVTLFKKLVSVANIIHIELRAENARLRAANAELVKALEYITNETEDAWICQIAAEAIADAEKVL